MKLALRIAAAGSLLLTLASCYMADPEPPQIESVKRGTVLLGNAADFRNAKGSLRVSSGQTLSVEVDSRLSTTGTAFRPNEIPLTREAGTFWIWPWKRAYSAEAIDRQSGCR